MRRIRCLCLLAFGGLLLAIPTRAEVVIRAPYVNLALGQPAPPGSPRICIHVPFFDMRIARGGVPSPGRQLPGSLPPRSYPRHGRPRPVASAGRR